MAELNLTRSAQLLFAGFHATPALEIAVVVIVAWVTVVLNDVSSALLILLTAVLLLTLAIQSGLLLAPGF
jgi:hypothetical protein